MNLSKLDKMDRKAFLQIAMRSLPDEEWIERLENRRGKGRNDYPIRSLWQSLLLLLGNKLPSIAALTHMQKESLPSPFAFSRFLVLLADSSSELDQMLLQMVAPEKIIALGNFVFAKKRICCLWNVRTGLPFLWDEGGHGEEPTEGAKRLFERVPLAKGRILLASPEYASLTEMLWRRYKIRPIIPLPSRSMEKKTYRGAFYNDQGEVFCSGGSMVFAGFEEARGTLKYRCAVNHYGARCHLYETCPLRKNIRIPLKIDPLAFTPLPRSSSRWQKLCSMHQEMWEQNQRILLSHVPRWGKKAVFLRLASLLFAAAYRELER